MYKAVYNKDGTLKHSNECKMAFGRKDANCPRCQELLNGAKARAGWQSKYYAEQQQQLAAIRAHYNSHKHLSGACGPVCTFGDY